jgi:hypothetical protein
MVGSSSDCTLWPPLQRRRFPEPGARVTPRDEIEIGLV